jgi:hypothetical protein
MRNFNIAFVAMWFIAFFSGVYGPSNPINMSSSEMTISEKITARINYEVTDAAWHLCGDCTGDPNTGIGSADMANAVMKNTVGFVLFFVCVANFFFYAGNETFGHELKLIQNEMLILYLSFNRKRRECFEKKKLMKASVADLQD